MTGLSEPAADDAATRHRRRRVLLSLPWITIVAITAVVQFVRGAPVDGIVFAAVGAALLLDALGVLPDVPRLTRPGSVPVLVGVVAVGVLLVVTPRHGIIDGIALVGVGVAVIPYAWGGVRAREGDRERPSPDPRALRRTAIAWAATGIATCIWELTSWLLGRILPASQAAQHPALSDLLDPALDQLWFRALFVTAWLALGLALVTRGRDD